jgi:hypothetical protein
MATDAEVPLPHILSARKRQRTGAAYRDDLRDGEPELRELVSTRLPWLPSTGSVFFPGVLVDHLLPLVTPGHNHHINGRRLASIAARVARRGHYRTASWPPRLPVSDHQLDHPTVQDVASASPAG